MGILTWIIVGVVAAAGIIVALVILLGYNNLISKRNRVQDAFAQIDVQLKRRYDLIPNLVEAVKGYMTYERQVLTTITNLRSSMVSGTVQSKAEANNMVSQALKSIFAVAENYPDLKASTNFISLQEQLADTEDKVAYVRTSYNDYVLDYNNAMQTWPGRAIARWFNFSKGEFFAAPEAETAPVKVSFADVNAAQQQAGGGSTTTQQQAGGGAATQQQPDVLQQPQKRKRGRPPKNQKAQTAGASQKGGGHSG